MPVLSSFLNGSPPSSAASLSRLLPPLVLVEPCWQLGECAATFEHRTARAKQQRPGLPIQPESFCAEAADWRTALTRRSPTGWCRYPTPSRGSIRDLMENRPFKSLKPVVPPANCNSSRVHHSCVPLPTAKYVGVRGERDVGGGGSLVVPYAIPKFRLTESPAAGGAATPSIGIPLSPNRRAPAVRRVTSCRAVWGCLRLR